MEILLLIGAFIVLGCGVLIMVAPKVLIKANDSLNRIKTTVDTTILSNRYVFGVIMVGAGIFMAYTYFRIV